MINKVRCNVFLSILSNHANLGVPEEPPSACILHRIPDRRGRSKRGLMITSHNVNAVIKAQLQKQLQDSLGHDSLRKWVLLVEPPDSYGTRTNFRVRVVMIWSKILDVHKFDY
jgi:hypothetical protein